MTRPRLRYRRSLTSRVVLLTTLGVAVAVAFVAAGAFVTARVQLQRTLDASLLDRAHAAAQTPALSELTSSTDVEPAVLGAGDIRIAVLSPDERVFSPGDRGSPLPLGRPELAVARGGAAESIRTLTAENGARYRVVAVRSRTRDGDLQALVLAQPLASQESVLAKLGFVMLLFGVLGVLAAALAGWGVARNGLRPVRRLSDAADEIARTEDLTPLPVEGSDEIARLAASFNQVLTALGASRDRQRRLVADAGHELRTPLTSLRTNIELLTQATADGARLPPGAQEELLGDVRAQLEELTTLIGDLVELARDEPIAHGVGPVELHETVGQSLARVRRRAPGLTFDVDLDPWWLDGEQHSLERAVTNLLDNAAKWSPPGGTVRVRLHDGTLLVEDAGPGIAEPDLPHVFERFYRSEESRAMPGSGLGLSIVAQVAERHAGSVSAGRSDLGGARLALTLPGRTGPDASTPPTPPSPSSPSSPPTPAAPAPPSALVGP